MSAEMPKMPEPFAKWWAEKGQFISAKDEGDFSLERDIAEASWQEAARQAMERFDQFKRVADISEIALHEQNNDLMRQIVGLRSALDIAQRYVALQKAPWSPMVQAEDLNTVNRALIPQSEERP